MRSLPAIQSKDGAPASSEPEEGGNLLHYSKLKCDRYKLEMATGRAARGPGRAWKSRPAGLTGRNGAKIFLFKSPLCNGKLKVLLMFYKFY